MLASKVKSESSSSARIETKLESDSTTVKLNGDGSKLAKKDNEKGEESDGNEDTALALEMMENSWAILYEAVKKSKENETKEKDFISWAEDQLPRILIGIGDVHSFRKNHADATDAYIRAIPFRETAAEKYKSNEPNLEDLRRKRLLVEVYVLIAEELLKCPVGDVVTTEGEYLAKGEEKEDFARGYYDKARDQLQETVYLMGKIAGKNQDLGTEKEDICFLATILMAVGNALADIDDEKKEHSDSQPAKKIKKG